MRVRACGSRTGGPRVSAWRWVEGGVCIHVLTLDNRSRERMHCVVEIRTTVRAAALAGHRALEHIAVQVAAQHVVAIVGQPRKEVGESEPAIIAAPKLSETPH